MRKVVRTGFICRSRYDVIRIIKIGYTIYSGAMASQSIILCSAKIIAVTIISEYANQCYFMKI